MENLLAETFGNITWVETIDLTLFFIIIISIRKLFLHDRMKVLKYYQGVANWFTQIARFTWQHTVPVIVQRFLKRNDLTVFRL